QNLSALRRILHHARVHAVLKQKRNRGHSHIVQGDNLSVHARHHAVDDLGTERARPTHQESHHQRKYSYSSHRHSLRSRTGTLFPCWSKRSKVFSAESGGSTFSKISRFTVTSTSSCASAMMRWRSSSRRLV